MSEPKYPIADKHSPEPWTSFSESMIEAKNFPGFVCHAPGLPAGGGLPENPQSMSMWPANKARIIECVNACAGIPNPAPLAKAIKALKWVRSRRGAKDEVTREEFTKFHEGLEKLLLELGVIEADHG
jgi:hypothetical protein